MRGDVQLSGEDGSVYAKRDNAAERLPPDVGGASKGLVAGPSNRTRLRVGFTVEPDVPVFSDDQTRGSRPRQLGQKASTSSKPPDTR